MCKRFLLAFLESRPLRGEQRVNRGYRPVTGRTSGGKPNRVEGRLNIKELISRTRRCRICREKKDIGHASARTKGNQCQEMAKKQTHHSLSTVEETTIRHVTLDRE